MAALKSHGGLARIESHDLKCQSYWWQKFFTLKEKQSQGFQMACLRPCIVWQQGKGIRGVSWTQQVPMCRERTEWYCNEQVLGNKVPVAESAEHQGSSGLPEPSTPGWYYFLLQVTGTWPQLKRRPVECGTGIPEGGGHTAISNSVSQIMGRCLPSVTAG